MPTMNVLKDCGILKYIERRTGRIRIGPVNLFDRTSTESGFFSSLHPKGVNVLNLVVVPKQPLQMSSSICKGRDQLRLSLRNKSPDFVC